jgi:signal transduction histidine kinase/ActR/RegA family two-component response regulator
MEFRKHEVIFSKKYTYSGSLAIVLAIGLCTTNSAVASESRIGARDPDFSKPIRLAVQSNAHPSSFVDKDGKLKGFAVEISDAVARTMGLTFERRILDRPFDALERGHVEMVQFLAETDSRKAKVDFSVPILRFETVVVVRKGETRVRSLMDLKEVRVGVGPRGTAGDEFLSKQYPRAIRVYYSGAYEGIQLLADQKLDAAVMSRITALTTLERTGIDSLKILDDPITDFEFRYGFAVAQGNTRLLARLNEGLDILHRTGEYDEILQRWLSRYQSHVFTTEELSSYIAGVLGLAMLLTTLAFLHQRKLLRRIAGQRQELTEQRSLLTALFDLHPMATLVLEFQKVGSPLVVSMNSQAQLFFGLDPDTSLGKEIEALDLNAESRQIFDEALIRWKRDLYSDPWELSLNDSHRIFETTLLALGETSLGRSRICLLIADVTRRRQIEQGLAQARRLESLGAMVGGIAHEFNNLLMPIVSTVETMRETCPMASDHIDELQIIDNAVMRATDLTRRLLAFGRKGNTTPEPIQVADIVSSCLALIRPVSAREIEWATDIPTTLPAITFNQTDFNQIVLNLIINARDALKEKLEKERAADFIPRITIRVQELPENAQPRLKDTLSRNVIAWQQLTVEDTGPGIPPEVIERIFEPFFTTKEVGKGTGLGLATVWQLVTDAGGTITVDSTVGKGTRFHVCLPRYKEEEAVPVASSPAHHTNAAVHKMNILLVEDELLLARSSSRGLKRFGHQVTIAADGVEAWSLFDGGKGTAFEILVVDINMPRMNGLELIQRVRASNYKGRIFLTSGRLEAIDATTLATLQIERVLVKPFMISTLAEAIENPPSTTN